MIKIFHMGDVHLDCAFGGDITLREKKRARARERFAQVVEYIKNGSYDLVLIPGDLYESESLTRDGADFLRAKLGEIPCPVVIAPGNHDPYVAGSFYSADLPENVHVFTGEGLSYFDFDEISARVYGYAFTGISHRQNALTGFVCEDSGRINILCAHGDTTSPLSPYAPLSVSDMESAGFTYCALAHVHRAPQTVEGDTTVAYSGFLLGQGFDETGNGTAVSVAVEDMGEKAVAKAERVVFEGAAYEIVSVDVDGAKNDGETAEIARKAVEKYGSDVSLRVILTGNVPREYRPDTRRLATVLGGALEYLEVKDNTLPLLGSEAYEADQTVIGELFRTLKAKMTDGDERERAVAALAWRLGLAALEDREITPILGIAEEEGED